MLTTLNISNPIDLVIILIGVILVLKRVVEMDRYQTIRVVVLTSILSSIVIYSVFASGLVVGSSQSCVISFTED